jgi:hypothetical protein
MFVTLYFLAKDLTPILFKGKARHLYIFYSFHVNQMKKCRIPQMQSHKNTGIAKHLRVSDEPAI